MVCIRYQVCGEVCPHTRRALRDGTIYSEIPFFSEQTISRLSLAGLDAMDEEEFHSRAFAWRGRETVRRNLLLFEGDKPRGEERDEC